MSILEINASEASSKSFKFKEPDQVGLVKLERKLNDNIRKIKVQFYYLLGEAHNLLVEVLNNLI